MSGAGKFLPWPFRLRNLVFTRLFNLVMARRFKAFGTGTRILFPDSIEGIENIALGNDVVIGPHSLLAARPISDGSGVFLDIHDGCRIGRNNHIYATHSVTIERRVLTASNVYIGDNAHRFDDPKVPIFEQPLRQLSAITIGQGSWIGHGACIIGASVGANSVVAANAVVTQDVPDRCVVAGAPAVIVKRFDPALDRWRKANPDGSFWHEQPDDSSD